MHSEIDQHGGSSDAAVLDRNDRPPPPAPVFVALAYETRSVIPTDAAAHHLNRKPQTLRIWACREDGPIRPVRINGRLGWRTDDIRRLVGVGDEQTASNSTSLRTTDPAALQARPADRWAMARAAAKTTDTASTNRAV